MKKSIRFSIFKRDAFACQYCGRTPPVVVLEIDHIVAVSSGGKDNLDNLITACFDCNRGKGASSLLEIPQSLSDRAVQIAEREDQLRAYKRLIARQRKREDADLESVQSTFESYFPDRVLSASFQESIRRNFLASLPVDAIESAMHLACSRIRNSEGALRYFCGICWRMIREA